MLALYFASKKRPVLPLVIPMLITTVVAIVALVEKLRSFLANGDVALAGLSIGMLGLAVWMLFEGAVAVVRRRREAAG